MDNKILSGLLGLATGDALGVPVEFRDRDYLRKHTVTRMTGYGTYNQPAGTWSDDSSLTFCLVESLITGYSTQDMANKFISWYKKDYWTPYGEVFDIGITTRQALNNVEGGIEPTDCGGKNVGDNGNGSLMRILPLAFYLKDKPNNFEKYQTIHDVSAITHGHIRSMLACSIYVDLAVGLLNGLDLVTAYNNMKTIILSAYSNIEPNEIDRFDRVLATDISKLHRDDIKSSGYVVNTLEASIWCLLTSNSYTETVLKAVNLGGDTDTTAAVVGGLAGIYYGAENIPKDWLDVLARKDDIVDLCTRFSNSLKKQGE